MIKISSIILLLGIAFGLNLEIELDVKITFLHGELKEENYIEQPEGKENLMCKLNRSLYVLKQASKHWHKKFHLFILDHKYIRTCSNHSVFFKKFSHGGLIVLLLYVDEMLIVGQDTNKFKKLMGGLACLLL